MEAGQTTRAGKGAAVQRTIWPWTLNVEGKPARFSTQQEAAAHLRTLWQKGIRNIDVGCMQVNMGWNGRAYSDPVAYLDPTLNVQWAGWRLTQLAKSGKTLTDMVMSYHAPDPRKDQRRLWYACQVQRELSHLKGRGGKPHPDCRNVKAP